METPTQKGSRMTATLTVIGNLTAAPEIRFTQTGLAVANFTVASTEKVFDKQTNDWKDGKKLFMRCSVWREFAEHVAASLDKGMRVIVVGKIATREYETTIGEKRSSVELDVEAIGPDLRYCTAQVTRADSSRGTGGAPARQNAPAGEPWAESAPSPQGATGDVWNQPGSYSEEAPF